MAFAPEPAYGGTLSLVTASSGARSPFSACWTRVLRCPWARSPRRSRPGGAAVTPGGLAPTLEEERGDELAHDNLNN